MCSTKKKWSTRTRCLPCVYLRAEHVRAGRLSIAACVYMMPMAYSFTACVFLKCTWPPRWIDATCFGCCGDERHQ